MEQITGSLESSQNHLFINEEKKKEILHRVTAEQEERYRTALEVTCIGTWDLDLITRIVYWDDLCKELYGFHKDNIVPYDRVLSCIHPDDVSRVHEAVKASLGAAAGTPYDIVYRTIGHEDGKLRWLHCRGLVKLSGEGKPVRFTGTAQDITKQYQHKLLLEASEARYRDLIENSPVGKVIFTGRDMVVDMINDTMLEMWGKDRSIIGKTLSHVMPELEGQSFFSQLREVYDTGMPFFMEEGLAYISKNGAPLTPHWFKYSFRALYDVEGKIHGIINTATEITSVVEAKQVTKQVNDNLQFILDAAALGIWSLDIQADKILFDDRAKQLLGYPVSGSIGLQEALTTIYEADRNTVLHAIATAYKNEQQGGQFDVEQRTLDGKTWLRVKGKASFNAGGKPILLSGIVIDITAQKELQTVKDDFIKMASHELKTPLASAIAFSEVLSMELAQTGSEKAYYMVKKLRAQVSRLNNLVGDLLDISKINAGKLDYTESSFDFDELVLAAIEEVQVITSTHRIESHLNCKHPAFGDKDRIRQVIINLITNAVKYSPGAKRVIVSTNMENDEITLCVEDFGIGIDKENQQKVFEQFYRVGKDQHIFPGLGLGLYISSQIIQNTEGRIWRAASEAGKGSTFCFALPCDYRRTGISR